MNVGQIWAVLGVDPKEYEKGLRKAEKQADQAGSKIGTIFKNAFSVTIGVGMFEALKQGFRSTVGAAVDFNAMLQTAQIGFATMLGSAEKAQKFLDDMADFAVRTPFEYPELLEAAKRMLAYGFAAEEVLPTLRAVGDASAALGSGSVGIDRITLALGQIRAKGKLSAEEMRQLTEAGVPAWHILAEAMGKTVPELQDMVSKGLIPGHKAVIMLTQGMTQRFGGMMQSMENTWQGVTSSIKDIWRMTVGTLTSTLFAGLNNMLIKVRDFLSAFYTILRSVMGKKAQQQADDLASSTGEQAAAMAELGDETAKAAKKAQKNLQTFDEVHQLQEDMSDTAAGDMFAMPGIESPVSQLETEDAGESETFTKMQETLEKLAVLFDPAIDGFNRLKEAASPLLTNVGEGLKWFWENILVPFGTWTLTEAIPAFFDLLAGVLSVLNPILEALAPLGRWLWEEFLKPAAEWTGQAIVDGINWLADALKRVGDWISEHSGLVETFAIIVGSFAAAWGLVNIAIGIWNVIGAIATGVTAAFGAAVAFLTSPIGLVVLAIGAVIAIVVLLIRHWDDVKAAAGAAWDRIKQTWEKVSGWFDEHVVQPLKEAWDRIKQTWEKISGWFDEHVVQPLKDLFAGLKEKIEEVWDNIWGSIKFVINKIIDGINWVIDALNSLSIKIPDWVPKYGGQTWGINIPKVPKLDVGTNYVPRDMLAYLHEGEAVVPKKYNPAADGGITVEAIEQAMYRALVNFSRIAQASTRTERGDFVVRMNSREVARETLPEIIRELQRQGFSLIIQPQGV